eukprot:scaffold38952_cov61-Phaeocystis_antarctica.AAC.2
MSLVPISRDMSSRGSATICGDSLPPSVIRQSRSGSATSPETPWSCRAGQRVRKVALTTVSSPSSSASCFGCPSDVHRSLSVMESPNSTRPLASPAGGGWYSYSRGAATLSGAGLTSAHRVGPPRHTALGTNIAVREAAKRYLKIRTSSNVRWVLDRTLAGSRVSMRMCPPQCVTPGAAAVALP